MPTVIVGNALGDTVIVLQTTVSVSVAVPVQPFASVTRKVSAGEPGAVGVPLNKPFTNVMPFGSVPAVNAHVSVPLAPVALSCCE